MKLFSGLLATAVAAVSLLATAPTAHADTDPLVVAHRGYTGLGSTENTRAAITDAFARGADVVELDVQFTGSGWPVLNHDATVDRTTTGSGRVDNMTVSQFANLTTNDGGRPATLAEGLAEVNRRGGQALIELKTLPTATQMARFDEKVAVSGLPRNRIVVQSFNSSAVWLAHRHGYKMARILTYATTADWAKAYDAEAAPYNKLTAGGVATMHAANTEIYAWTVNDPSWWPKLDDMNVDRIVTDSDPADVKQAMS